MATQSVRIGVPSVLLSLDDSTAVPNLTSLVFDASAATPTTTLFNEVKSPLATSTNYQVMLALVGRDATNGGYTVAQASPGSGIVTVTAGQGIKVHVANANWPAGYDKAICAAIFLKQGSSTLWTLNDFAYIDVNNDFNHMFIAKPLTSALTFTQALLQSVTTDAVLGNRTPLGVTYTTLGPTTNGVTVTRNVSTVNVAPDNGPDYQASTSTAAEIQFATLPNNVLDVARGVRSLYVKYTGDNASTIEEAQQTLITAQALFKGNRSIILTMPVDALGLAETRLYIGNLTITQAQTTESWSKTATTPITFILQTAAQDAMLSANASEIIYKRQG